MQLRGTYRGDYLQNYLLEAETSGEVGNARFRWSHNQGQSWEKTNLTTAGADEPVELEEGLSVFWGIGAGDGPGGGGSLDLYGVPPRYHYQVFGGPFEAMTAVYLAGEEDDDRVTKDAATGLIQVSGKNASVSARVVKDHTTHPVDMVADILAEVGLEAAIHQDSFALAKSLTPEYAMGVSFENVTAAQASGRSSGAASMISGSISGRSRSGRIWVKSSVIPVPGCSGKFKVQGSRFTVRGLAISNPSDLRVGQRPMNDCSEGSHRREHFTRHLTVFKDVEPKFGGAGRSPVQMQGAQCAASK